MDPMNASRASCVSSAMGVAGAGGPGLMAERRRRPVCSPVSLSLLATRTWRATSPFTPLLLLAMVFGLSLGVVRLVEEATLYGETPAAVSTPAPSPGF